MSIIIKNLSKRYDNRWALRDVSLDPPDGEIFGVFGPAGSGKSTLLRIIAGTEKHNGGSIDRYIIQGNADGLSYLPALPAMSVWERTLSGNFDIDQIALRQSENLHTILNMPKNLLLLDDPFRFSDPKSKTEQIEMLRKVVRENKTTAIVATDDFDEILAVCDRAAVIVEGCIIQIGAPSEIYEKPASGLIADITGRNNLFEARRLTSSKADIPEFHTIEGGHRLFTQKNELGSLGALNRNVTLGIRPENISITFGASFPEDNLLKATIQDIHLLGHVTLVDLDAGGLRLCAAVVRLVGLGIGEECMVGLPPDRIMVLQD